MKYIHIFITIATLAFTVNYCTGAEQSGNSDCNNTIVRMKSAIDPSDRLNETVTIMLRLENIISGKNIRSVQTIYFAENYKYHSETKVGIMPVDIRGFNGVVFWKKNVAGVVTRANSKNSAAMRFLISFMRPGAKFEKIFTRIIQDKRKYRVNDLECILLKCYPPEEYNLPQYLIYVDTREYLIRRTVIAAPEFDQTIPVTTDFHDYLNFGQIKLPSNFTIYLPGATIKSRTSNVQIMNGVPNVKFSPPEQGLF